MIDTIGVQYQMDLGKRLGPPWDEEISKKGNGGGYRRYFLNVTIEEGTRVHYTYYPHSIGGFPLLILEFSLPNVISGNNVKMITDFDQAVSEAELKLSAIPGFPLIDLMSGILCRLDIFFNHQVGELVPYYIKAFQSLHYSHRKTLSYSDEGVQFGSKKATTKFYNKYKECKLSIAKGILRQEITLRKPAIKDLTGKKRPTLADFSGEMFFNVLEGELDNLGLNGNSIGTHDSTLKKLCEEYGECAGTYYFGLLQAMFLSPSKENIISDTGIHPRSLDRKLKKIRDAGIPMTLTEYVEPLPPLSIDRSILSSYEGLLVSESM